MTLSNSLFAFADCVAVMDAAISDSTGIRVQLNDLSAAYYFRLRCHHARRLDRIQNGKVYPPQDPRHFASEYDRLVFRIRDTTDGVWIYVEKNNIIPGVMQSLTSGEEIPTEFRIGATPAKLLPSPEPKYIPPPDLGEAFDQVEVVDEPKQPLRRV